MLDWGGFGNGIGGGGVFLFVLGRWFGLIIRLRRIYGGPITLETLGVKRGG